MTALEMVGLETFVHHALENGSKLAYNVICLQQYYPYVVVVVVVDPLLPDYWRESASVVLWGFAASFSRQ